MKMLRLALLSGVAALLVVPVAEAKGPSKASITGPGVKHAIIVRANGFNGGGDAGPGTPLGDLTQEVGFFPSAYEETPSPMQSARPKGDLGPKYTITYTVPDGSGREYTLHQDVYPYAKPVPVAYMAKGQDVFGMKTGGGWYVSDSSLRDTLVHAGLPARAPASATAESALSFLWDTTTLAIAGGVLLVGFALVALRRRPPPIRA